MTVDKQAFLESLTDDELLGELARRANEAQRRADRLRPVTGTVGTGPRFKSLAKSQAKRAYWESFRASGLTLKQFQQKSKRPVKGK